jgi:hypothetical protein
MRLEKRSNVPLLRVKEVFSQITIGILLPALLMEPVIPLRFQKGLFPMERGIINEMLPGQSPPVPIIPHYHVVVKVF